MNLKLFAVEHGLHGKGKQGKNAVMWLVKNFGAAGWGYMVPCFVSVLGLWLQKLSLQPQELGTS